MLDLLEHLKKLELGAWSLRVLGKVDWMLDLSECLKKMVDDERGPCGCDEASQR